MMSPYFKASTLFMSDLLHEPEIDFTCAMMAEFGVLVNRIHPGQLSVPIPQFYKARNYQLEPDFITAAYYFAAAALTQNEITIQSTKHSLFKQPEWTLLAIFEKMGCQIQLQPEVMMLKGPLELKGVEINIREYTDVYLFLAIMAIFAKTYSIFIYSKQLSTEDKNKFNTMESFLTSLGVKIESDMSTLKIFPSPLTPRLVEASSNSALTKALHLVMLKVPDFIIKNPYSEIMTTKEEETIA
jgi:3-phosphoshikimate 1-carboxyvinyltransferase